jgi:starch phosphorylase
MMYDVQLGKIHTSKRQLLHVLYLLHCYLKAKKGQLPAVRRFHIFAGKAAPSDFLAKQIIHLISATADRINGDPLLSGSMQVVFIPDFSMSWAERVAPAVDLSEQLSTPMLEPAGTFNVKFALNGAVTLASQSGANIDIAERIGKEYIFTFGKSGEELAAVRDYRPGDIFARDDRLKAVFSFVENELIPRTPEGQALHPLLSNLRDLDRQFVLGDFNDYAAKQEQIDKLFPDTAAWMKMAATNIARSGYFSSDRVVQDYAHGVWKVSPL